MEDIRNLPLNAEDAELLAHMLRFVFNNHTSANIKVTAIDFLKRLENLQNQS